jgi:hypothetical protein
MPSPTCPDNCDVDLAPVKFDDCNPKVLFSEIRRIFIGKKTGAAFSNWLIATEWITRLSNTSVTGDDYIRALTVIADKPAGAPVTKQISNGRTITIGKDNTLNFTIDDVTPENYEWMRTIECGGKFRFWFETSGGYIYGGNEGFLANFGTIDDLLPRGLEEIETIAGTIVWRSKFSPDRGLSPIYDGDTPATPTSFDSIFDFDTTATPTAIGGASGTASATDADQHFEFNVIASPSGLPMSMNINVSTVLELVVDFPSDYEGAAFRYTDKAGAVHAGVFTDGDVDF